MNEEERRTLRAARSGDRSALGRLAARHGPRLLASLERTLKDRHFAEDVVQESLLRAVKSVHRLSDGSDFRSWLRAIARNVTIDLLRRAERRPSDALSEPDRLVGSVGEPRGGYIGVEELWRMVSRLPVRERRLLLLRYGRGLSNGEVAAELGMTEQSVKTALHRGRERLREMARRRVAAAELGVLDPKRAVRPDGARARGGCEGGRPSPAAPRARARGCRRPRRGSGGPRKRRLS